MIAEVADEFKSKGTTLVCYTDKPIDASEIPFECTLLPSPTLKTMVPSTDVPKEMRSHVTAESVGSLIYTSGDYTALGGPQPTSPADQQLTRRPHQEPRDCRKLLR